MAEHPKTAKEYAKQLNTEEPGEGDTGKSPFTLVTNPEHWTKYDVIDAGTDEDDHRYLLEKLGSVR